MEKRGIFNNPTQPQLSSKGGSSGRNPFQPQPSFEAKHQMWPGGDYYGTGFKAPVGKLRSSMSDSPIPQKSMRIPPKALA